MLDISPYQLSLQGPDGMQLVNILRAIVNAVNELENGGGGGGTGDANILHCVYGTTTAAEIRDAIDNDYLCMCEYADGTYYLTDATSNVFYFTSVDKTNSNIKRLCCNNGIWTNATVQLQNKLTFDNTPTQSSTNPVTSGGVYTALQGKDNVFWATYGSTTNAEINSAISTGKVVACRYQNRDYYLMTTGSTSKQFVCLDASDYYMYSVYTVGDTWYTDAIELQAPIHVDNVPTENSTDPVSSGGVYSAIEEINDAINNTINDVDKLDDAFEDNKYNISYRTITDGFYFRETRIYAYSSASIYSFPVKSGVTYHIESAAYKTGYAIYPTAMFTTDNTIAVGDHTGTIIIEGIVTAQSLNVEYTPNVDGYIWINHFATSGEVTVYSYEYAPAPQLKGKKIAVIGDSIMQYMSGGYGGANTQTFVENGNTHTYDELTIVDGIPYYNGNECTVVNSSQAYYESQGWEALKRLTQANTIVNCSIGGAVLGEGTIATPYPGYESGTYHTNSLPNLVRWLFRECENTPDPDIVVIWMGTNGIGTTDGDIDTIFAVPWDTLSADAGHDYRQTNIGGLRYAIERIYREMPHTYILVIGPIQADPARFQYRTFSNLLARSNMMKSVANRIGIKFIEALTEVEIYGPADTASSPRYLSDGLHCTDAGKQLLTDFLGKKFNIEYQYKP